METRDAAVGSSLAFARRCHPACIACRDRADGGLGLDFEAGADGTVRAHFACDSRFQGYPDRLHGGVVAMLLDATMTHCLFHRQVHGVTARLAIRYHHPVDLGVRATVSARLVRTVRHLFVLESELVQEGLVRATGEASFFRYPDDRRWAEAPDAGRV
jgi:uncharacterized protein (TIGR00369 family)